MLHPPREPWLIRKIKPRCRGERQRRKLPGSGHFILLAQRTWHMALAQFPILPVANSDKRRKKNTSRWPRAPHGYQEKQTVPLETFQSPASTCPLHSLGCRQERGVAGGWCDLSKSLTFSFSNYHQQVTVGQWVIATLPTFQRCCEDTMR